MHCKTITILLLLMTGAVATATSSPGGPQPIVLVPHTPLSNGGVETHTIPVEFINDYAEPLEIRFNNIIKPVEWHITFSEDAFTIPAHGEYTLNVTIETGFAHVHGETRYADLQYSVDGWHGHHVHVGIQYTDVPKLTGHHSQLFMHVEQPDDGSPFGLESTINPAEATPFLNTLQEDVRDDGGRLYGAMTTSLGGNEVRWDIPVDETVMQDLLLDASGKGRLELDLRSDVTITDVDLQIRLVHELDATTVVAEAHGYDFAVTRDSPRGVIDLPIAPDAASLDGDGEMRLEIHLSYDQPSTTTSLDRPYLDSDLRLELPLLEI